MNFLHDWLCRSDRWRKTVEQRIPWALRGRDLGPRVLELGPGPGLTTDLLRLSVPHLTTLELDPGLAKSLRVQAARQQCRSSHRRRNRDAVRGRRILRWRFVHHVTSRSVS